ncbi:hypothetical protein [Alloactinosynnema sp. L-07]|nr:hypothetical protein [Alloactinosynnema sp. L-07]
MVLRWWKHVAWPGSVPATDDRLHSPASPSRPLALGEAEC